MKKIIIILTVLIFLITAGIVLFAVTFDANRYRDTIEKEAAKALGHAVKIGNIALVWRGGLALEVDGVQVLSNDEPVLQVQNAGAVLQLAPLLRRSVQVGSVFIDGAKIRAVKGEDGVVRVLGINPPQVSVESETQSSGEQKNTAANGLAPALSSFLIAQVDLKNIDIHYEDDSALAPLQLDLKNLALTVKNVSLFKPMEFNVSGAFFGNKKNVNLRGVVKLENQGADIRVDDLRLEADLDLIERDELVRSLPQIMQNVPLTDWGGKLEADISQLKIRNGKPDSVNADLLLKDGFVETLDAGRLVQKLDVKASNVSLSAPFDVQVKAAVFSSTTNLSFQGKAEASNLGRVIVGPAQVDLDLNSLNWAEMTAKIPAIYSSGLSDAPQGRVHADIRRLSFEPGQTPLGDIDFRYDQGRIRLKNLPSDLNQIQLTGNLRGDQLSLDAWNMSLGSSPAEGRLNVQNLFTAPVFRLEARARNLNLKDLAPPPASPDAPAMEGTLSFEINAGGNGKVPEVILPSLSGSGHFRVDDPVLRNMNVLEEILSKLAAIPGLSSALDQRMSDSLKERRARRDTPFETMDEDFSIERGAIRFNQFDVVSPDVKVSGAVNVGVDGSINARPTIWIHEEIMAELAGRVHELAYTLNSQGQMQIPLTVTGTLARMSILPDIQYLLAEIVRNKAGQLLADQFTRKTDGSQRVDRLSQLLGTTTGASSPDASAAGGMAVPTDDSAVPVKIYPSQQKPASLLDALTGTQASTSSGANGSASPSKTDIAAGLINAFLSNSNQSDSNTANSQ